MKTLHPILLFVFATALAAQSPSARGKDAHGTGRYDSEASAMADLLQVLQGSRDPEMLAQLMRKWAASDLPSAMEWIATYPQGEERDTMMSQVCLVWAETAPREAATLALDQVRSDPIRNDVMAGITRTWGMRSSREVRKWLKGFPDAPWLPRATDEVCRVISASKFGGTKYGGE